MSQERIRVSLHAGEQASARFPGEFPAGSRERARLICKEVGSAIREGRMATRVPRWAVRDGVNVRANAKATSRARRGRKRPGGAPDIPNIRTPGNRFVWTEDERRLYLIDRGGEPTTVITCIRPDSANEEAA